MPEKERKEKKDEERNFYNELSIKCRRVGFRNIHYKDYFFFSFNIFLMCVPYIKTKKYLLLRCSCEGQEVGHLWRLLCDLHHYSVLWRKVAAGAVTFVKKVHKISQTNFCLPTKKVNVYRLVFRY